MSLCELSWDLPPIILMCCLFSGACLLLPAVYEEDGKGLPEAPCLLSGVRMGSAAHRC